MSFNSQLYSELIYTSLGDSSLLAAGAGSIADYSNIASLVRYIGDNIGSDAVAIAAIQADLGNPSIRTNLKSIELMLGCPDVAASSIHDLMAKELTLDGLITTVGVAGAGLTAIPAPADMALDSTVAKSAEIRALDTVVDAGFLAGAKDATVAKEASLGALATSAEIAALDGVVDAGFLAAATSAESVAIKAVVDDVQDNIGTISNTTLADTLAATLGDFVATPLVDRLDNIQDRLGGFGYISSTNYTDAGGEQTIIEITPGASMWEVNSIFLDLVNITKDGVIKVYLKIDGTNYRELFSNEYSVATDSDGVWIDFKAMINDDLKVTYTEDSDEGSDRSIPWQYVVKTV